VTRCFAPIVGLFAVLAPAMAHAQTNLDQGKSASQIFAAACVECHKAPRGLANGKSSSAVTEFLSEHYTTSRQQAAALAAYVLGGRGTEPVGGSLQRGQKPAAEGTGALPDEAKPPKRQARQPVKPDENGPGEFRSEAKSDAKPETKPEAKSDVDITIPTPRNRRREAKPPQPSPAPAEANRGPNAAVVQPDSAPPAPPISVLVPAPTPTPERSPAPETSAPPPPAQADAPSGDNAPVPRDNVPD
jgi:hypothetical protein